MSDGPKITKELLLEGGGWKEMKEANRIHRAGQVSEAKYEDGVLEGLVRIKGRDTRVRLEIDSATRMENHCPCYPSRRDGLICGHALAVGLEFIEPTKPVERISKSTTAATRKPTPISAEWPKGTDIPSDEVLPAQLHLVLPGNFEAGFDKGSILCGIECHLEDGPRLLAAVPSDAVLLLDAADLALFRALQQLSPEVVPGMLNLAPAAILDLLGSLVGHDRVTFAKKKAATIAHRALRPPLLRQAKSGLLRTDWSEFPGKLLAHDGAGAWFLTPEGAFHPLAPGLPSALAAIFGPGLPLDPAAIPILERHFDLGALAIETPVPVIEADLEGSLRGISIHLRFRYRDRTFPASAGPVSFEEKGTLILRHATLEAEAVELLRSHGFSEPDEQGLLRLRDENGVLAFLAHGYPSLPAEWRTSTGERFVHASTLVEPIEPTLEFRSGSGQDWFALEFDYQSSGGASVSRDEIQRLLRSGRKKKPLANGRIGVLNEALHREMEAVLLDIDPQQDQPGEYRIDLRHAEYLEATAKAHRLPTRGALPDPDETASFEDLPAHLEEILRPYQREGVAWLQRAAARSGGGILADDMGLGKTVQALSFLYVAGGQSLVVAPSSLVHNWVAEAQKFVPDLTVVALEGPGRHKVLAANPDAHLYVTSYALLRLDAEVYRDWHFQTILLDEAQHLKNPDSQIARRCHELSGSYRFALTGTPIENSVRDLWSITQFAVPGYLGGRKEFAERFEKPLTSADGDPATQARLQRRLQSLMLRRLKTEVAPDLPEKITQVVTCRLNQRQRAVYDGLLKESRRSIEDADGSRKQMIALTALLRLRQCCCDLRLLGMTEEKENPSAKMGALEELLANAIEGGHRVLVFSQFVEMLQVLVPFLGERGIDFAYLDGRTKNRAEVVARFQSDETVPVFLISLKAGGVGLNLTGADTVIHLDPWWNPAVEDQATDRAHRIGQTRVVTCYKLIAENTVEEKILALQEQKRNLTDSLTQGELLELLG